jgi:uncharacterized DUF497 family protein
MFAWDEAKRRANLRKRGIDFVDAAQIFRGCAFNRWGIRAKRTESGVTLGLFWKIRSSR